VLGVQAALNWIPRQPAIQRLKEVADHLQSLDQEDFFTYSAKNFIAFLEGDWEALQIGTDAGVRRFPSHPGMHHFRALALAARGHFDECLRDSQRAVRLGPRDTSVGVSLFVEATCHFMREDYAAAAAAARAANQANPSLPSPPVLLAAALQRTGDREGARLAVAEVLRRQPAYRAEDIGNFLRGQHPRFLLGRDRAIASLREAGLP
jgi:tetratricopeptide (TPR) repeat protein